MDLDEDPHSFSPTLIMVFGETSLMNRDEDPYEKSYAADES